MPCFQALQTFKNLHFTEFKEPERYNLNFIITTMMIALSLSPSMRLRVVLSRVLFFKKEEKDQVLVMT